MPEFHASLTAHQRNIPAQATYADHGCPQYGFYWGQLADDIDLSQPELRKLVTSVELLEDTGSLRLVAYDGAVLADIPANEPFWWSAEAPGFDYWEQRAARQQRDLDAALVPPAPYRTPAIELAAPHLNHGQAYDVDVARRALLASQSETDVDRYAYHCGALEVVVEQLLAVIAELTGGQR